MANGVAGKLYKCGISGFGEAAERPKACGRIVAASHCSSLLATSLHQVAHKEVEHSSRIRNKRQDPQRRSQAENFEMLMVNLS